jgi:hypothetical protein
MAGLMYRAALSVENLDDHELILVTQISQDTPQTGSKQLVPNFSYQYQPRNHFPALLAVLTPP